MYINRAIRIIALLILFFSLTMLPPIITGLIYKDKATIIFIKIFLCIILTGGIFLIPNLKKKIKLKIRDNFIVVITFWLIFGSIGALPFIMNTNPKISVTDAFFESFSGITTTGATTLKSIELLPHCILLHRQILQWFGGIGIILLIVAMFPFFKKTGVQLCQIEISSLLKYNKKKLSTIKTTKILCLIYLLLTIICFTTLYLAGMSIFEAINYSFSIISLGGFSIHNTNINYYHNVLIHIIIIIFLLISSCNYILHFNVINKFNLKIYWKNIEFRVFCIIQIILVTISIFILHYYHVYISIFKTIKIALFQIISITTTAGFYIDDIYKWPLFLPTLIFTIACIGGCSGSTSGGIKIIRIIILYLQGLRELKKIMNPNVTYNIQLDNFLLNERKLEKIWGFLSLYIFIFFIGVILLITTGINNFTSFICVATTLNNLGVGMDQICQNFCNINAIAKWILIILMLLGRLEIFTLVIILTPYFWKKK